MSKRLGQWLIGIGIISQLLPALGIAAPLSVIFGTGHTVVGFLTSAIGGLLYGLATGKQQLSTDKALTLPVSVKTPPTPLSPRTIAPPPKKDTVLNSTPVKTQIAPPVAKGQLKVTLVTAGPSKIQVIREVHALTGLSLTQARAAVEGAPRVIKENLPRTEASLIKIKLEALGARVELK